MKAYIFLADGFEEIEALTPADVLRRGGIDVTLVSIMGREQVVGAHNITVKADTKFESADYSDADIIVMPGGQPGTRNLSAHEGVLKAVTAQYERGGYVAAICAAPTILGKLGILKGRKAVCFPGCESELAGAKLCSEGVVTDGNVITGRSMGTAMDFSIAIAAALLGEEKSKQLEKGLCR